MRCALLLSHAVHCVVLSLPSGFVLFSRGQTRQAVLEPYLRHQLSRPLVHALPPRVLQQLTPLGTSGPPAAGSAGAAAGDGPSGASASAVESKAAKRPTSALAVADRKDELTLFQQAYPSEGQLQRIEPGFVLPAKLPDPVHFKYPIKEPKGDSLTCYVILIVELVLFAEHLGRLKDEGDGSESDDAEGSADEDAENGEQDGADGEEEDEDAFVEASPSPSPSASPDPDGQVKREQSDPASEDEAEAEGQAGLGLPFKAKSETKPPSAAFEPIRSNSPSSSVCFMDEFGLLDTDLQPPAQSPPPAAAAESKADDAAAAAAAEGAGAAAGRSRKAKPEQKRMTKVEKLLHIDANFEVASGARNASIAASELIAAAAAGEAGSGYGSGSGAGAGSGSGSGSAASTTSSSASSGRPDGKRTLVKPGDDLARHKVRSIRRRPACISMPCV